jgi:outer membrane protein OmpA-like peptidoglycan-associated protein
MINRWLLLSITLCLMACKRPAPEAAPATPSASPSSQVPATPSADQQTAGQAVSEPLTEVTAAAEVKTDPADAENRLVRSEVLSRIDVMPNLADDEKDKLYVQVERARGMGKLLAIPFASGQRTLSQGHIDSIKEKLNLPQFTTYKDDPTVVFVVLGFADKAGDRTKNLSLSRERAEVVANTLKTKCGVMNLTHSVGMGSSEMFDSANLDKNRIVEIWAVLP